MRYVIRWISLRWNNFRAFIAQHTIGITAEEWKKWDTEYRQRDRAKQPGRKSR